MKYKNKITNEISEYPCRFRTREEFENKFGVHWAEDVLNTWCDDDDDNSGMNYLFGTNLNCLDDNIIEQLFNGQSKFIMDSIKYKYWNISSDMIIPNEKYEFSSIYLKNKQNVYENKIFKFNEYKKGDF